MIHKSLPQTKTTEALAVWITDQKKETLTHEEQFELTKEEIQKLEHSSAQASAALYRLKEIEDMFKEIIKGGTLSVNNSETGEPELQPATVTIPPTKGTKALEANRKFADDQLKSGYRYEYTNIYLIPWPEESKMVAVDIEGKEWPSYTRFMTNVELNSHKPLLKSERSFNDVTISTTVEGEEKSVTMTSDQFEKRMERVSKRSKKEDEDPFI